MHHLIFPSKDSYVSNLKPYDDKNFGIDEILRVGSYSQYSRVKVFTQTYTYPTWQYFECLLVDNFTGTITGSFSGSAEETSGSIVGAGMFTSSYFFGTVTGSVEGDDDGLPISDGQFTGSLIAFSGSISASTSQLDGYITGSLIASYFVTYTGYLSGSSGRITGYLSGSNTVNEQGFTVKENKTINRALLKFDLTAISQAIDDGAIVNPQFKLKLKIAKEEELPLSYKIHGFPVSQSWEPGIGYLSDGGADVGVSWNWRDFHSGNEWYAITSSDFTPTSDYLNDPGAAVKSFERGGGTWYYDDGLGNSMACSQSFDYETSDVDMDVTPIVYAWLSGSIPNEGFIVMNSTENSTGSNGILTFFSRDTNTIYSPVLDVAWDDSIWVTQSVETGSVVVSTVQSGINATVQSGSSFVITGGIAGVFSASTFLQTGAPYDAESVNISGIVVGAGLSGNIVGMPVIGNIAGTMLISESIVTGPCGSSFTSSFVSASFTSGIFSGSTFGAYYVDNKLENAYLTGSWTEDSLLGAVVNIPIPSGIEPFAYAYVTGLYVNGTALGTYEISGSTIDNIGTDSASFHGQFISGNLTGGVINAQLSGSVFTSSYQYTSSVNFTSSSIHAVNSQMPFTAVIQNLKPKYTAGNVARINVFGREEHPLKNFTRQTQMTQYLIPKYLPSSSYYAIKDNETEEIIIDFDNYTRLSCDLSGNFFILDTTSFAQERNYRILLKVDNSGSVYVYDNDNIFKIMR